MITLKNKAQISRLRDAGKITGEALLAGGEAAKPGVSTHQIDTVIRRYIEKCGAKPTFLGYGGFPGSACISVNDEVIHGIPSVDKILKEGTSLRSMSELFTMAIPATAQRPLRSARSPRRLQGLFP